MSERIEVHEAEEWSAVYLDGKLMHQGDSYLADEWIRNHFNVVTVQDDAFMRGSDRREDVAKTLTEVQAYADARDLRQRQAADLERDAEQMLARAKELRS